MDPCTFCCGQSCLTESRRNSRPKYRLIQRMDQIDFQRRKAYKEQMQAYKAQNDESQRIEPRENSTQALKTIINQQEIEDEGNQQDHSISDIQPIEQNINQRLKFHQNKNRKLLQQLETWRYFKGQLNRQIGKYQRQYNLYVFEKNEMDNQGLNTFLSTIKKLLAQKAQKQKYIGPKGNMQYYLRAYFVETNRLQDVLAKKDQQISQLTQLIGQIFQQNRQQSNGIDFKTTHFENQVKKLLNEKQQLHGLVNQYEAKSLRMREALMNERQLRVYLSKKAKQAEPICNHLFHLTQKFLKDLQKESKPICEGIHDKITKFLALEMEEMQRKIQTYKLENSSKSFLLNEDIIQSYSSYRQSQNNNILMFLASDRSGP